jgi:hypothetical protein
LEVNVAMEALVATAHETRLHFRLSYSVSKAVSLDSR